MAVPLFLQFWCAILFLCKQLPRPLIQFVHIFCFKIATCIGRVVYHWHLGTKIHVQRNRPSFIRRIPNPIHFGKQERLSCVSVLLSVLTSLSSRGRCCIAITSTRVVGGKRKKKDGGKIGDCTNRSGANTQNSIAAKESCLKGGEKQWKLPPLQKKIGLHKIHLWIDCGCQRDNSQFERVSPAPRCHLCLPIHRWEYQGSPGWRGGYQEQGRTDSPLALECCLPNSLLLEASFLLSGESLNSPFLISESLEKRHSTAEGCTPERERERERRRGGGRCLEEGKERGGRGGGGRAGGKVS